MSRYPPFGVFLLGIAINNPFSPSMIRISCTAKLSSSNTDAIPFILEPSFSILRTFTDVIFICYPPSKASNFILQSYNKNNKNARKRKRKRLFFRHLRIEVISRIW